MFLAPEKGTLLPGAGDAKFAQGVRTEAKRKMKSVKNKKGIPGDGLVHSYLIRNPHTKFIFPAMLTMVVMSIIPTVFLFIISLTNYQLGWDFGRAKFVGLQNFIRLFSGSDPDFWHSVFISLAFMLLATAIEMIVGFLIAMLLNSWEFKLKALVIGILIIPLATTPSIAAQMWKLMFNAEYGILNYYLQLLFNVKVTWLSGDMAFWSVLLVDIWQFTPFVTLIVYAGLRSMPHEPYESAAIDGASAWQELTRITIPMMHKLLYLALLFRAIDSLKLFDTAYVLTQGGPGNATEFLSLHIYRMANAQNGLIGRAAAIAIVLLVLVTAISSILIRQQRKED
ncbi:multiple sugar transport system permease protein [Anaerobacterium chartisolvens]|uniref:Multiple sugar transport system permease protein n=2 Tax=Anaerobacterium chartisolvens TaxID=1297424 RepID=A0A369B1C7_9FIRM|nr:multiple sugar transport system permease protein [Anaerobacterium chartisolvens]